MLNSSANYRFYRQPLVLLTLGLSCGILLGFEFREWTDLMLLVSAFFIILSLVLYLFGKLTGFPLLTAIFLAMTLTGVHLIQSHDGIWEPSRFSEVYQRGDPMIIELKEVGKSDRSWKKMTGTITGLVKKDGITKLHEPIVLFVKIENFGCDPGDVISVYSEPQLIRNAGNPGEFDAEFYWNRKGFRNMVFVGDQQFKVIKHVPKSIIRRYLDGLSNYLGASLEENLSGRELAIAKALILGDKSLLDTEIKNSFTNTGAMHVLAVSGLHVGIIMQILMAFFGFFSKWISRRTSILIVVAIMWIYAVITGLSPSVLRAVFMFSVLVLAQIGGKQHNSINSLFFTAFVIFLFDPFTLFDIGFQLSFLAMLGIFLFYRPIDELIYFRSGFIRKIWQGTAIGFAAQLMTTPLSLFYFHQFPNYFILTNIGLMASSGLILGLGIFIFSVKWLKPLAKIAGWVLGVIIFLSLIFIEWVESLPGAVAYGFEISLIVVIIMGIIALVLFTVKDNGLIKYTAIAIAALLLNVLIYQRYLNLDCDELCVFNHKKLIVTVKKDGQILCFYDGGGEGLEKVKFIVEGYKKLHPGEIRYISLSKMDYNAMIDDQVLSIDHKGSDFEVHLGKKKFIIAYADQDNSVPDVKLIGMPWIESKMDHNLHNGAYITSF